MTEFTSVGVDREAELLQKEEHAKEVTKALDEWLSIMEREGL